MRRGAEAHTGKRRWRGRVRERERIGFSLIP